MTTLSTQQNQFKDIWEISNNFYCSIVGTCLSLSEQKKILQKEHIKKTGDYETHGWIVSSCACRNNISLRVNRLLKVKYAKEMRHVAGLKEDDLMPYWQDKLHHEDICGAYWAMLSRRGLTAGFESKLFGDVHMLSHYKTSSRRNGQRQIKNLQEETQHLNKRLLRESSRRSQLLSEIDELKTKLQQRADEPRQLQHRTSTEAQIIPKFICMQQKIERQQAVIKELREQKKERKVLRDDLNRQRQINHKLNLDLKNLNKQATRESCSPECPSYATCARRILLVGGITKMTAHYRELIDKNGGVFEHHYGYMRDGKQSLEGKINRCDLVLCPVDVNSHNACLSVKKICKRLDKPYRMLSSSSLSTMARTLHDPAI